MDEQYAHAYSDLARNHWWWQARDAVIEEELERLGLPRGDRRILDVGCGDGRMFPLLSKWGQVFGIEPDPATLGTKPADPRICHAAFTTPVPCAGPFDVVTMFDVLEHIDDRAAALKLTHDLLRPGGRLVLTVPALPALWTRHDAINQHRVRYTRRMLSGDFRKANLQPLKIRHFFHSLLVPKMATRISERLGMQTAPLPRTPPPRLNRMLRAFFVAEWSMTSRIATWFPGSSLFAVAERLPEP